MTPDSLPCLIAAIIAFVAGGWCVYVFRPAKRVVDHRADEERRPRA